MEELQSRVTQLMEKIRVLEEIRNAPPTGTEMKIAKTIPLPKANSITEGNVKTNFKFFGTQKEYLTASGLGSCTEDVKKATLLSAIGEECLRVYENLPLTEADKRTADKLFALIEKHLAPTVNVRYERAMFNQAKQGEDESYDTYTMQDDLFLDKIICSVKSIKLKEQLCKDTKITLADAINKCKSNEFVSKQLKELAYVHCTCSEK